jgi:hypothetical protein
VTLIPFFTTCEEVERFVRMVDGRAKVVLLLETAAAVRLHEILAVSGIAEMMVWLNDLHLSIGLANPFALVASDFMTMVSDLVRARGIRFGFGRLARGGDDGLPIPSDLVLAQHARLASTSAWISRSFFGSASDSIGFEIARLRDRLSLWSSRPPSELLAQRDAPRRQVRLLASVK